MTEYNSYLMGAYHRDASAKEVVRALAIDEPLILKRDAENAFDPNAIQVWAGGPDEVWIGFIERGLAEELAPLIDDGQEFTCKVGGFGDNELKPYLTIEMLTE